MPKETTKKRKTVGRYSRQVELLVGQRNLSTMSLSDLLDIANKLFPKKKKTYPYSFELAKFPVEYGWYFNVISSWHNWTRIGLLDRFGGYVQPEFAVRAFIDYVRDHNVDVKGLAKD